MPDEISLLVKELENKGYVSRRQLRSGPEREAIVLSEKAIGAVKYLC
jgi:DNA-binding HxlR family transcriptional regulator